jgi:hypothetical protein
MKRENTLLMLLMIYVTFYADDGIILMNSLLPFRRLIFYNKIPYIRNMICFFKILKQAEKQIVFLLNINSEIF